MKHIFPLLLLLAACNRSSAPPLPPGPPDTSIFDKVPESYAVTRPIIEVSGIADSRSIQDHLWVHEDSGNPPMLYLLKHQGFVTDSFLIEGATNRDWEDVAVGKGPDESKTYIYVGDIGDNNAQHASCIIYRIPEPSSFADDKITEFDKIEFAYPDGARDAEALLIDDASRDIFIITKRDARSKVYRLPFPQSTSSVIQAEYVRDLPFTGVVSASLSLSGMELMLKTYTDLFYYKRTSGEGLGTTLERNPSDTLAYQVEPQGEAVAFANNNSGFFTYSEKGLSSDVPPLHHYRRIR